MDVYGFLDFINNLVGGFLVAGQWLNSPLQIGDYSITPLALLTFGGLVTFIVVALVKWVIS